MTRWGSWTYGPYEVLEVDHPLKRGGDLVVELIPLGVSRCEGEETHIWS